MINLAMENIVEKRKAQRKRTTKAWRISDAGKAQAAKSARELVELKNDVDAIGDVSTMSGDISR